MKLFVSKFHLTKTIIKRLNQVFAIKSYLISSIGTMLDGPGEPNDEILLSLGSDLTKQILLEHVGLSNGIAWNRELGKNKNK